MVISFVIAGIAAGVTALCSAELASMIPAAGSTYSYAYAAFGVFVAWFIGWDLLLEYLFAASTVAVGWAGYAVDMLDSVGIHVPSRSIQPADLRQRLADRHRQPAGDPRRGGHLRPARVRDAAVGAREQRDGCP